MLEYLYRRRELKNESLGRFLIKPGPAREETPRLHLGHVLEALLRVVSAHLRQRAHLVRARLGLGLGFESGSALALGLLSSERASTNGG